MSKTNRSRDTKVVFEEKTRGTDYSHRIVGTVGRLREFLRRNLHLHCAISANARVFAKSAVLANVI